jgi:predicted NBD/HSP70 family sugar kinase
LRLLYDLGMSLDLLLDIGVSKSIMAPIEGSVACDPIIVRRDGQGGEEWIRSLLASTEQEYSSVLVSATGLVSGGRVFSRQLGEIDVVRLAEEEMGIPALVINDGHAAALAAARSGFQAPLLAVHIGGSLAVGFWGERLWEGASGFAGEMISSLGGDYLSGVYRELTGEETLGEKIVRLAGSGNENARRATVDAAEAIADEICRIIYFADPSSVVFSGGEILQGMQPWLLPAIWERLQQSDTPGQMLSQRMIEISPLREWAPLYGAACMVSAEPDFSDFL